MARRTANELDSAADAARLRDDDQFRALFERAPIGMGLLAPDGRRLRVNAALCEMTGYAEDEMLAMTYADISHPDDVERSADASPAPSRATTPTTTRSRGCGIGGPSRRT